MIAFILAAGLGTRLRPLTDHRPKALVEIDGVPLLEIVLRRLETAGASTIVINTHHFAEQIEAYVETRRSTSCARLMLSPEKDEPLDTGGALWHARSLLQGDKPVLVHNVDVLSDIPLVDLYEDHIRSGALATMAVKPRETKRQLLFDATGRIVGRATEGLAPVLTATPQGTPLEKLAFCGIHIVSQEWFALTTERGVFGIVDNYLRLSAAGETIRAWRADAWRWKDVGRPEQLSPI
ncbi:MAG: sugar phosphate nucleotidyltransferase [Verrucomicrobiota bacterium]|nr:sugar phosphate nucleotidyltransferase [Verrucomicrobiota bacterium]